MGYFVTCKQLKTIVRVRNFVSLWVKLACVDILGNTPLFPNTGPSDALLVTRGCVGCSLHVPQ